MTKRWLFLSLCLSLFALPALASDLDWSVIGSGGEIDEDCLTLYEYSGARLKFKSTATGTITVRYPVSAYGNANGLQPPWDTMVLTAVDNSPLGSVTARLVSVNDCDGSETTICTVTGSGSPGCEVCTFSSTTINFESFAYYIEGTLTRSATTADAQLIMVSLGY
jgi:hypothetical protein